MKRKLALLMAAVMTLSMLPAMNAFGATGQALSVTPNVLPKRSVLYEQGVYQGIMNAKSGPIRGRDVNSDIEYAVDGTDLILTCYDDVKVGDTFRLSLENARLFFRGDSDVWTLGENTSRTIADNKSGWLDTANKTGGSYKNMIGALSNERWGLLTITNNSGAMHPFNVLGGTASDPAPFTNFDITKGLWAPTSEGAVTGTYVRFGDIANPNTLAGTAGTVNRDDRLMSIAVLEAAIADIDAAGLTVVTAGDSMEGRAYGTWNGTAYTPSTAATPSVIAAGDTRVNLALALNTLRTMNAAEIQGLDPVDVTTTAFAQNASASSGKPASIPYILRTDPSSDKEATITVLNIYQNQTDAYKKGDYWEFRIPLVVRTSDTGDIKVNISAQTAPVTTGTISLFSQTTSGVSTKTYADDYVTARTDFALETLYVKETRLFSIANTSYPSNNNVGLDRSASSGTFTLQAPSGFEWKDPNELIKTGGQNVQIPDDRVVNLGIEAGLKWYRGDSAYRPSNGTLGWANLTGYGYSGTYNNGGVLGGIFGNYATQNRDSYSAPYSLNAGTTPHNDYRIFYKNQGLTTEDRSILVVELYNVLPSSDLMGRLYIKGLGLVADETAKLGDVMVTIKDDRSWSAGVTDETFKVGVRAEWDIILKTISDIPTLVNGRYNKVDPLQAYDKDHRTARVQFEEQSINAWWSDRKTEFILPDWAKFRMVDFINDEFTDNRLQQASINSLYKTVYTSNLATTASRDGNIGNGIYINDNVKHGAVTINGNVMTLENLKVQPDQRRAKLVMDMWISIESGKTGDVQLAVAGSAIPVQSNGGGVAPVTIARAVNPINVTSKITDIKIGYQYQPTFDILITETAPAMLEKGKDVYVSVSDLMSTDMLFSPDTKVAVTGGNLKIKSINNTVAVGPINVATGATVLAGTGGTVTFNVDMASSVASTVTISNASVKIDRTVPETNKYPYKVIAWGPAVAPNYVYYEYNKDVRDKFPTAGIMADYLKVISSANDKSSILTQEVHVTIGETFFTVNGVSYDMDAAAYISTASNSTMVPVRFIANAFGISNEQVIWDDAKRTVTVVLPSRVIQFTVDSSTMLLDGSAVTMYSPDNLEVMAEIVGDRCYVPFRAMGEAFGVKVEWDDATQTAIYNPGAYSGIGAAAAAEETTATTAQ